MRPLVERDALAALATLRGATGRVVAISSVDVYRAFARLIGTEPDEPDPTPLTEDSPTRERLYPYRGDTPARRRRSGPLARRLRQDPDRAPDPR